MDQNALSARMLADEVHLSIQNEEKWIITCRTPLKVLAIPLALKSLAHIYFLSIIQIRRRDLELPIRYKELPDYPPMFHIHVRARGPDSHLHVPKLMIDGLDDEYSFQLVVPRAGMCFATARALKP